MEYKELQSGGVGSQVPWNGLDKGIGGLTTRPMMVAVGKYGATAVITVIE
jgi:hypothetical protein